MDAISVKAFGEDVIQAQQHLYLHCIDFHFIHSCTIKSMPFMTINLVGGHVSFDDNPRERRIAMFPNNNRIREFGDVVSPCIIKVITCCELEVSFMETFFKKCFYSVLYQYDKRKRL